VNDLFGDIPPEIGEMAALMTLYLYDNYFTGTVPTELAQLTSITILYSIMINASFFGDYCSLLFSKQRS